MHRINYYQKSIHKESMSAYSSVSSSVGLAMKRVKIIRHLSMGVRLPYLV